MGINPLTRELVNVPVDLLYSRRRLFEKIMQNLAKRKVQNTINATEARMATAPQQFGAQLGKQTGKQAALTEGLVAAVPGTMSGGMTGLGVGGLYGLISGAYGAEKGNKLRGALRGLLRGAGGGGLIGAGIGGGLGLGTGLMMPNVLTQDPVLQAATAVDIARRPISHAAKMTLGAIGGGVGGGYLGNKARKALLGDSKKNDKENEEPADEKEEEDKPVSKAAIDQAAYQRVFGQAKGNEIYNRRQGLQQQANQLRAANPGAAKATGTFQQGKLMPLSPPAASRPAAPQIPRKSVTSDAAADFF